MCCLSDCAHTSVSIHCELTTANTICKSILCSYICTLIASSIAPEWTSPLCATTTTTTSSNNGSDNNDSNTTPLSNVQQQSLLRMQTPSSDTREIAVALGNVRLDMHEDSAYGNNNNDHDDTGAATNTSNSSEYSNVASYRLYQVGIDMTLLICYHCK
jgi:hypothetical protein